MPQAKEVSYAQHLATFYTVYPPPPDKIQGIPDLITYSIANPCPFVPIRNYPIRSPIRESVPHCKKIACG